MFLRIIKSSYIYMSAFNYNNRIYKANYKNRLISDMNI